MRYEYRKPNQKHKNFRILKFDGKFTTVQNPELDSINAQSLSVESKLRLVKDIVRRLNNRPIPIFNNENEETLNNYWVWKYENSKIIDKPSARYKLQRAVRCLGQVSINTATASEIHKCLDKLTGNKQREAVKGLRSILRYLNRNIHLNMAHEELPKVRWLSEPEFKLMIEFVKNPVHRTLCRVAFYTGARLGECLAFEPEHLKSKHVTILAQIRKTGELSHTKTRKPHHAVIWPQGIVYFNEWVNVKSELVERSHMSQIVKSSCKKAFKDPRKHLTFHDLRHSYAINLVRKGNSLHHVAQCLGNTVAVCEKYYVGFVITDDVIEAIRL
jgi:integrase